jgi:hypothetical protein
MLLTWSSDLVTKKPKKIPRQRPLALKMPFYEALRRFIGTDPAEVEALVVERGKKKKSLSKKVAQRSPSIKKIDALQ